MTLTRSLPISLTIWSTALCAGAQSLPDDDSQELVESVCSACHSTQRLTTKHWTRNEWESTLREMLQDQTDVTQPEREEIVAYLVKYFGRNVNVNKAAANDLENALEISSKDAEAVVRYRQENGSFKSLDDLKKVPGLDPAKLDAKKNYIQY